MWLLLVNNEIICPEKQHSFRKVIKTNWKLRECYTKKSTVFLNNLVIRTCRSLTVVPISTVVLVAVLLYLTRIYLNKKDLLWIIIEKIQFTVVGKARRQEHETAGLKFVDRQEAGGEFAWKLK